MRKRVQPDVLRAVKNVSANAAYENSEDDYDNVNTDLPSLEELQISGTSV